MLNEELDLVKVLSSTLASSKEDPSLAARYKGRADEPPPAPRDPDDNHVIVTHHLIT